MCWFGVLCLDSGVVIVWVWEYFFNRWCFVFLFGGWFVMGKVAVFAVELVDESFAYSDGVIAEELFLWFRDAVAVPWVKEVKRIVVKSF